jgi:aspartate/methionine/tyrosine aminotransferase
MADEAKHESVLEAHKVYHQYHRHYKSSDKDVEEKESFPMFHRVGKTGVIYATSRAKANGFDAENEEWANMGQGAPETGPIEGAPSRDFHLNIPDSALEYAPVVGNHELRTKVAEYYNHLYRQGKDSQYGPENVCIVPGGRAGIVRIMSILGEVQTGFFSPDYTAYEQALGLYLRVTPSSYLHRDMTRAMMSPEEFKFQTTGRGVGCVLMSNPSNPTGQSIEGDELKQYVDIARETETALLMDEFYSHYYYDGTTVDPADGGADDDSNWPKTVSSAVYIEDVNEDPIVIINGLTKNWRCPGFRVCWIVAPKDIVEMLGSAGSYLDGGANAPLQTLGLPLMDLDFIRRDTWALQRHFRKKRDFLIKEITRLGLKVKFEPHATFYVWADLSGLPPPLNDCLVFLEECVKHQIICVPGVFFDLNPRGTRNVVTSPCNDHVRFSYGPPMRNLTQGVKHMEKMINKWKAHPTRASVYEREAGA